MKTITLFAEEVEEAVMQYLVRTHGADYDQMAVLGGITLDVPGYTGDLKIAKVTVPVEE